MAKRSFLTRIKEEQENIFIGRASYIESFTRNFESNWPIGVFNIYGQGGVGKTFLSKKFMSIAQEKRHLTIYTEDSVKDILTWFHQVSEQLKLQRITLSNFDKQYKTYQQQLKKLEADPEKPKSMLKGLVKFASRGLIKEGKKLPGTELLGEFVNIDEEAASSALSDWADFAYKKLKNKDEVELVIHPVKVLSALFWEDIYDQIDDQYLCFFMDTFEETDHYLEKWLLDVFDGKYGNKIPEKSIFIIAGRDELPLDRWSKFGNLLQRLALDVFDEEETEQFFLVKGVTEEAVRQDIIRLSNNLPILLALLAETAKIDSGNPIQDKSDTAVERFLKGIKDDARREVALSLAIPRTFNQDTIELFISEAQDGASLFDWLVQQPFVQKKGNAWVYHQVVREQTLRYLYHRSRAKWEKLHDCIYQSYLRKRQELEKVSVLGKTWVELKWEEFYHLLCMKPENNLALVIAQLFSIIIKGVVDDIEEENLEFSELADVFSQVGDITEYVGLREWVELIEQLSIDNEDEGISLQRFLLKIHEFNCIDDHSNKAFLLTLIGVTFAHQENYELALKYSSQGMALIQNDYFVIFMVGHIYSKMGESEHATDYFNKAISLSKNNYRLHEWVGYDYYKRAKYDLAIKHYQKALAIKPDYYMVYDSMGDVYYKQEQYDLAIEYYQKALGVKPNYHIALDSIADVYYEQEQYDLAIEYYQKVLEIKPDNHITFNSIGNTYYAQEQYDLAIEHYQKAVKIKPDYHFALNNIGNTYSKQKRHDLAIEYYQKVLEIKPGNHITFNSIGNSYYAQEQYDLAIEHYQKAMEMKPDYHIALNNMGYLYYVQKKYDLAIEYYQKALDLKPSNYIALNSIGNTYSNQEQYGLAIEYYQKALDVKSDYHIALDNIADVYYEQEQYDLAIEYYQKALDLKPDYHIALNSIGNTYSKQERYDLAIEYYQKALDVKSDDHIALDNIADVYANQEQYDLAIEYYQKVLDLKPDYHFALDSIADLYYKQGQYDLAIEHYQKSVEIKPDHQVALSNIGYLYHQQKKYDLAIVYYQKAVNIKSGYYTAIKNIGDVYYEQEQYDLAIEYYQKAVNVKPDYYTAIENIGDAYVEQKKYDLAIEYYHKAVEVRPNDITCYMKIGGAYYHLKKHDLAIAYCQKVLELEPHNYEHYILIGILYMIAEHPDRANDYYNQALQLKPDDSEAYEDWLFNVMKYGMLCDAKAILEQASQLARTPKIVMYLGHFKLVHQEEKEAVEQYRESLQGFTSAEEFKEEFESHIEYLERYGLDKQFLNLIIEKIVKK
ncbi:MAG: tetratricopeptide repeat protein [Flammeovirgaceae bacterium]